MAFLEIYGISPMTYLKAQRLHGARYHLQTTNPKTATVVGIATRWGFWHMGYFSHDYKQMFGESPSQTLKRG
jgi:AraC family ethanolamine operon transcriptional activator